MIRIFFLSQSSPILELFPFDKITLKSYICTVVTVMAKQCWSQTVLESGSWGHSVLQTPALVDFLFKTICCGYSVELPRLVEAIQMSTHNICFYKVDKNTLAVI